MLHDLLRNTGGVIGLLVFGLLCAALAPYIRSGAGTPQEIEARAVILRRSGLILAAAAAAILILRRFGLFR
jgi:hypothetical protein